MLGPFNLGRRGDYRVLDCGLLEPGPDATYLDTAALVVEILSPGDETFAKLPFYAAHNVDEVMVVDLDTRHVQWLTLVGSGEYQRVDHGNLIDLGSAQLADLIDWPPAD